MLNVNPEPRITVLSCQLDVPLDMRSLAARDEHLDRVAQLLDDALSRRSADVVVLPELSSISYTKHCFSNLDHFAESAADASFQKLSVIADKHATFVLYGAPRIGESGYAHISQFLIDSAGEACGVFDKLHMAQFGASMEKDYFTRGDKLLFFDVKGVRLAPLICYDMRFPELAMTLAQTHKVHGILHSVAFFRDLSFYSWHAFVIARALENQVYWLSINRAGTDFGASIVCAPWIDESAKEVTLGQGEELLWTDIDTAMINKTRLRYTFGADKYPNYKDLKIIRKE